MNFIKALKTRNLIAQVTNEEELIQHIEGSHRTAYVGFDPTADSLHVGHLFPIMILARWQRSGHRAIALMGGGTAMVGDPTNKSEMRQMLEVERIDQNIEKIKKQMGILLDFSDQDKGLILNNGDWLRELDYLPFLREIGSQFSVNKMLTAECFKTRLEKGLSFLELNYMLLQSYDFLHLFRNYNCTLQLGGDDQWSNMLAGADLIRRLSSQKAYCLTSPLFTTSSGQKMGKTEKGAVWLDSDKVSPYEYYQFWRNIPDDMVGECLKRYTFLEMDQISELSQMKDKEINKAKGVLAYEATKIIHGEEEALRAQKSSAKLFSDQSLDNNNNISQGNEPVFEISKNIFGEGMNIIDVLVKSKIFSTKSEVRRIINQGGLSLNGVKVTDIKRKITKNDFLHKNGCLFKKGKKYYYYLRISN